MAEKKKSKLSKSGKFKVANESFGSGNKDPMSSVNNYSGIGRAAKRTGTRGDK